GVWSRSRASVTAMLPTWTSSFHRSQDGRPGLRSLDPQLFGCRYAAAPAGHARHVATRRPPRHSPGAASRGQASPRPQGRVPSASEASAAAPRGAEEEKEKEEALLRPARLSQLPAVSSTALHPPEHHLRRPLWPGHRQLWFCG